MSQALMDNDRIYNAVFVFITIRRFAAENVIDTAEFQKCKNTWNQKQEKKSEKRIVNCVASESVHKVLIYTNQLRVQR